MHIHRLDQPHPASEKQILLGVLLVFATMVLLAVLDITNDVQEGTTLEHVVVEGITVLVGLFGSLFVVRRLLKLGRQTEAALEEVQQLSLALQSRTEEAAKWRQGVKTMVAGLGAAIESQFHEWHLSPAEQEVGLLLLKGLSHKEIAEVRSVTEATARQQARSLYRKGGLAGRHDLSAFFLEDLMLPSQSTSSEL